MGWWDFENGGLDDGAVAVAPEQQTQYIVGLGWHPHQRKVLRVLFFNLVLLSTPRRPDKKAGRNNSVVGRSKAFSPSACLPPPLPHIPAVQAGSLICHCAFPCTKRRAPLLVASDWSVLRRTYGRRNCPQMSFRPCHDLTKTFSAFACQLVAPHHRPLRHTKCTRPESLFSVFSSCTVSFRCACCCQDGPSGGTRDPQATAAPTAF